MNKKEKRQQMVKRQQDMLNAAKAAHRELSAEEQAEFDSLQRQIETLNAEIEQEERQQSAGQGAEPPAEGAGQERGMDPEQVRQQERTRISEITNLCREFGMEDQLPAFISGYNSV